MAVTVTSISPADAETGVVGNSPVIVEINDSVTDLDHDLVEIIVNGVSSVDANGDLDYWNLKDISGGVYIDELQTVTYATLKDWYRGNLDGTITITVKYNSITISTTTFEFIPPGRRPNNPSIWYSIEPPVYSGRGAIFQYWVEIPTEYRSRGIITYNVNSKNATKADVVYTVGYIIKTSQASSMVVGELISSANPASTVVNGRSVAQQPASVIVQGWMRASQPSAIITGISFRYGQSVSTVVGVEIMSSIPASAIVYGVVRETTIDIEIQDASTKTLLEALGVTFS